MPLLEAGYAEQTEREWRNGDGMEGATEGNRNGGAVAGAILRAGCALLRNCLKRTILRVRCAANCAPALCAALQSLADKRDRSLALAGSFGRIGAALSNRSGWSRFVGRGHV
jgi:hypothetical protein